MDDQFPPKDENSAKADFVVPESGPGEEAANFSAKAQQEKFLGGSSENPPEASKGFLDRIVKGAKKAVVMSTPGGAAVAIAFPESTRKIIEQRSTPTEGSKGFLKDWFNKDLKPMAEKIALYGGPAVTFLLSSEIPGDIARADYRSAAIKGVIAGLSAAPAIIKGTGPLRR